MTVQQEETNYGLYFGAFCLWAFVIMSRPQDMFPTLNDLRPALLMGVVTLILVVLRSPTQAAPSLFEERQIRYYAALFLVMVLGIPFSLYPRLSFMTVFTGYINVVLFVCVFYVVVDSLDKLRTLLLVGCLGNGLYSAFAVMSGDLESGRLTFGSMFDPNDLGFFSLSFLPLNLLFMSKDNPVWVRLSCISSFCVVTLLILLTGSRGGMFAFTVVTGMLLFMSTLCVKSSLKFVFVALCAVIFSLSPVNVDRYLSILDIENDYNVQAETGRLAIWKIGAKVMIDNPLTGVGVRCFDQAVGLDRKNRGLKSQRWQSAHSSLIQIGAETGIIGLVLYILLSLNVLRIFARARKAACQEKLIRIGEMGLVGFVGLFVSGFFLSQAYSVYWAFYVVFSAVVSRLLGKEESIPDVTTAENLR